MINRIFFSILLVLGLFLDQGTKILAEKTLMIHGEDVNTRIYQGRRVAVIEWGDLLAPENPKEVPSSVLFQFNYVRNHGASWGLLSSLSDTVRLPLFHTLTVVLCSALLFVVFTSRKISFLLRCGCLLLASGALGNFVDRLRLGYVVDMLDLRWYFFNTPGRLPVFNVADMFVVLGLGVLIIWSLSQKSR